MSRDPHKLEAFVLADALVVSVTANLVEGSARRSERDYLHFVAISIGSASEVRYLLELAVRLGYMEVPAGEQLTHGYGGVIRALQSLSPLAEARSPRSEALNAWAWPWPG